MLPKKDNKDGIPLSTMFLTIVLAFLETITAIKTNIAKVNRFIERVNPIYTFTSKKY